MGQESHGFPQSHDQLHMLNRLIGAVDFSGSWRLDDPRRVVLAPDEDCCLLVFVKLDSSWCSADTPANNGSPMALITSSLIVLDKNNWSLSVGWQAVVRASKKDAESNDERSFVLLLMVESARERVEERAETHAG